MSTSEKGPPTPLVFYASQSGSPTLDAGEGGGNPFASALIELLQRPSLTLAELHSGIVRLTQSKSQGFQIADAPAGSEAPEWALKPVPPSAKRVALVFVYSDYSAAGASSLPGARRDAHRVAAALTDAGFDVGNPVVDPTAIELQTALNSLAQRSIDAESAVLYVTGHGLEQDGQVYLMPNAHPIRELKLRITELAIHVPRLGQHLHAEQANLVFFGGCRTLM